MLLLQQLPPVLIRVATISVSFMLVSCDGSLSDLQFGSVYPAEIKDTNQASYAGSIYGENLIPRNYGEVPPPTAIIGTNVRYGMTILEWTSSAGDILQTQPEGDSVSFYSVYRNGEHLVDAFSPMIEDASAPAGMVVYSVEAVKYTSTPEFTVNIEISERVELTVTVPTAEQDRIGLGGDSIGGISYAQSLEEFKSCTIAHSSATFESICVNDFGYAWPNFEDGRVGELLRSTSSVSAGVLVNVRNSPAEFGPIPDLPTWSVRQLATDESVQRELLIDESYLQDGERYVVNGVAGSTDGTAYISGTLYQSYLPRSFAPSAKLIPITNGYYIAQFDQSSGELLQFKRFSLKEAPGAAATINNGILEMHSPGLVSFHSTATLEKIDSLSVSGYPRFGDDQFYYTQAFDPDAFYRFARTK